MSNVAELPIEADRYGACVRQIYIQGLDLTGIVMRAQVRLAGDTPGTPLVDLQKVTNGNAEGLRLVDVQTVDGVPISHVELVINEVTIEALPYAGELGSATELRWDWQVTIAGRKQRIAKGAFVITGDGVTGADNAPANRPAGSLRSMPSPGGMRTGATLTFGDETTTIMIDGANIVGLQVDRAVKAAAGAATSQGLAAAAAAQAGSARDAALLAGRTFTSVAAGLAASTDGQTFAVPDGNALSLYQRQNGAAVLVNVIASQAGIDGIARLVRTSANVDNAPLINAALANPLVAGVILPAGTITIQGGLVVPSGKFLRGAGKGVTRLKAMTGFAAASGSSGLFTAMITSAMGAVSPIVSDLTCDGSKIPQSTLQIKGVVMYRARNFLVENVEVIDINSYSFWACGIFGDADNVRPTGIFRAVRSINANVHFECSNALGVLWDGMEWSGGDGEMATEGVYHSLAGSKNITYRHGRQIGTGGGIILYVVSDEDSVVDNIRFIDCRGFGSTSQLAVQVTGGSDTRRCTNIEIDDCDVGGSSIGFLASFADVRATNSRLDARSNEGVVATNGANVELVDCQLKVTAVSSGAAVTPLSADPTSTVTMTGGRLWYVCDAGLEVTSFPGNVYTLGVSFGRGATGREPIRGAAPGGIGGKVRAILTAAHNNAFGTIIGDGTPAAMLFTTAPGAKYRVVVTGQIRAVSNGGGESPGVGFAAYGDGGLTVAGQGRIMTALNAGSTGGAERIVALQSFAEQDQFSTVRIEPGEFVKKYPFRMEAVIISTGTYSLQVKGWNAGEIQPGATFEVERIA